MKILIFLLAVCLLSCNNDSAQRKIYEDSAKMFVDSFVKYKATAEPLSDSAEIIRSNRFFLYKTLWEYYKKKAEDLK